MDVTAGKLRELRDERGMSQHALSAAMVERGLKWSQAAVWAVERGERNLRFEEAVVLADILVFDLDWLAGIDPDGEIDSVKDAYRRGYEAAREDMLRHLGRGVGGQEP